MEGDDPRLKTGTLVRVRPNVGHPFTYRGRHEVIGYVIQQEDVGLQCAGQWAVFIWLGVAPQREDFNRVLASYREVVSGNHGHEGTAICRMWPNLHTLAAFEDIEFLEARWSEESYRISKTRRGKRHRMRIDQGDWYGLDAPLPPGMAEWGHSED